MKRFLFSVPVLLVLLMGYYVQGQSVHAQPQNTDAKPFSYHNNYAALRWTENVSAALVTWDLADFPTTVSGSWERDISLDTSDDLSTASIGVSVTSTSSGVCPKLQEALFYEVYGRYTCYDIRGYIAAGYVCDFGVGNKQNINYAIYFNMDCGSGRGVCPCWSCSKAASPSPWNKTYLEEVVQATWGGYLGSIVSLWQNNRYLSTQWNWFYRSSPYDDFGSCSGDGCPYHVGSPPQMYWTIYPGDSSNGGILTTCERSDDFSSC